MSLAQRLGFDPESKLLILTCNNLGAFHSANTACYDALRNGIASNASLLVPAPWARAAMRDYRGSAVGVCLTLNAEFPCYRWGPITHAPSLEGGEAGFPTEIADLWDHADAEEVYRECRVQLERAIVWGFDPTHLSSHLDAMVLRPELFDVYLDLAAEFGLPVSLCPQRAEAAAGFPLRQLAAEAGVITADHTLNLTSSDRVSELATLIAGLEPGVTEIRLSPAVETPELSAITPESAERSGDYQALMGPDQVTSALKSVEIIDYEALRSLQRQS